VGSQNPQDNLGETCPGPLISIGISGGSQIIRWVAGVMQLFTVNIAATCYLLCTATLSYIWGAAKTQATGHC